MTALNWIQNHGVEVSLEDSERVRLDGLDRLKEEQFAKVVEFAKRNKSKLLAELRSYAHGECDPLAGTMCKHCVHHSVTCVCNGPCTAKGMVRDPECFACHAFVDKDPRKAKRPAYHGRGYEEYLQ